MKVHCSTSETVSGTSSLIAALTLHYQKNPDAKVKVYSDQIADRHDISVLWQEER